MKTFTIELVSVETNFQGRANYEFSKELDRFLIEHKKKNGTPLGEDMAIFVTMMTKTEAENLKETQNNDALEALSTLQKSIKKS